MSLPCRADDAAGGRAKKAQRPGRWSVEQPVRLRQYYRQVVAELRKVIWPDRKQMGSYTSWCWCFWCS